MDYKEALEFAIDRTRERIEDLGNQALEVRERDEDGETMEKWAALRSAQGGMMECLDLMTQVQAMVKSFDTDPAGISRQSTKDDRLAESGRSDCSKGEK